MTRKYPLPAGESILNEYFWLQAAVPLGSEGDPGCIFSLMTHTKQLLLVTFCYTTAGIGANFWTHAQTADGRTEGQTDVEVEIVI